MKTLNIMTSSDQNLSKWILPQLVAIGENLSNYQINFFMVHSDIEESTIEDMRDLCRGYKNIFFWEIKLNTEVKLGTAEDIKKYEFLTKHGGAWPKEAYFTIGCEKYLPEWVDRILYIDASDVLILGDIGEFYFSDFKNCYITAYCSKLNYEEDIVRNGYNDPDNIHHLHVISKGGMFNAGSYMINVNLLRDSKVDWLDKAYNISQLLSEKFKYDMAHQVSIFEKYLDISMSYQGDEGIMSSIYMNRMNYFGYRSQTTGNNWVYNYMITQPLIHDTNFFPYAPDAKIVHIHYKPFHCIVEDDDFNPTNHNNLIQCFFPKEIMDIFRKWMEYFKKTKLDYDEFLKGVRHILFEIKPEEEIPYLLQNMNSAQKHKVLFFANSLLRE